MSTSRWNKLGQELERISNPLRFEIRKEIRRWTVHPDLLKDKPRPATESKPDGGQP